MNLRIGWRTDNPPPIEDDYLVTYDSGRMDICHWDNRDFFGRPQNSDGGYRWYPDQYRTVVAWMPLPEPYKETENEQLG